jgi:choline monooxygenase
MDNENINRAYTLPSSFYRSQLNFTQLREGAFRNSWNYAGSLGVDDEYHVIPVDILPGLINEPLLLTRDRGDTVRCLSNVCTHRGNLLVEEPGKSPLLKCRYHGRCFGLDGKFRSMPGFEGVVDFPGDEDDLVSLPFKSIGPMHFVRLSEGGSFVDQFGEMLNQMSWFDFDSLELRPEASRDYSVNAHWALYVDNYLEGFHVPYVHPGLNVALDVERYHIELFKRGSLQIGFADDAESDIIDIPNKSKYYGERIYAFYWWIYPNMMFNFYPWGISVNIVEPVDLNHMKVRFLTFAFKGETTPDVSGIHQTELEDERIVEAVQRGMQSSFYHRGRYSPKHEQAVRHFHHMIKAQIHV